MRRLLLAALAVALLWARAFGQSVLAPWSEGRSLHPESHPPFAALFSADGRLLISAVQTQWLNRPDHRFKLAPNVVDVIDLDAGRVLRRLPGQGETLVAMSWRGGSLDVVYNDADGSQHVNRWASDRWRVAARHTIFRPQMGPSGEVERSGEHGAFSPDGRLFVGHYGHYEGRVVPPLHFVGSTVAWRTDNWSQVSSWVRDPGADSAPMAFVRDDRLFVDSPTEVSGVDADVRYTSIEDVSRLSMPFYLLGPSGPVDPSIVAGSAVSAHGADETLSGSEAGRPVGQLVLWGPESAAAFSPDGRLLAEAALNNATGSLLVFAISFQRTYGGELEPRAVLTHALDRTPRLNNDRHYSAVAFSPDGRWLAAGLTDGIIRVWDTASWENVEETDRQHWAVSFLRFTPDSGRLVVGFYNGVIRQWTLADNHKASR